MNDRQSFREAPPNYRVDACAKRLPLLEPRTSFISYETDTFYLMTDVNSSYCSIHQYLEQGQGRPAVVANGNTVNAGSCLAVSLEAKAKGVRRGQSLMAARAIAPDLTIYESCLPLYEIYSELFDDLLHRAIVTPEDCYRASCDEVLVTLRRGRYAFWKSFSHVIRTCLDFLEGELHRRVHVHIEREQEEAILKLEPFLQGIFATAYLIREVMWQILGLPLSIGIGPSIFLAKTLVDEAKPYLEEGEKRYRTPHRAICFPLSLTEAQAYLRKRRLGELCGIKELARKLERSSIYTVADVQDHCDPERLQRLTGNPFSARMLWSLAHGRDDVLPGYLKAVRDRD
ncbi:MAG: hypothetical protein HQL31_10460 [Planctomycetes bacterium]|nr:hypothetical protein [Planctomycetota bacterium]